MESGNSFDGENITSIYETPDMTLDDASIRKMFRKLIIYTRAEGNIETDIFLVLDQGESGKLQPLRYLSQVMEVQQYMAYLGTGQILMVA